MCTHYIKLRSKSEFGIKAAYVKCGNCPDCRRERQLAEQFRLNAEFLTLKKRGWKIAMATLTYDQRHLPLLPKCVFKSGYEEVPCFSRKDVKRWIDSVRHHFKYHNEFTGEKRMRYFIASEYGDTTHRPHHHAVLAWPPEVSYEEMHAVCSHYWTNGLLFPRDPRGDYNPRQDKHMFPFEVVGDATKALSYVSKYVCKDLSYQEVEARLDLNKSLRVYKDCVPFTMQSQSLGYSAIKECSDEQKADIYLNGMSVEGSDKPLPCPVYIRNKLVYDNVYVHTQSGKRLVRRQASQFFEKYKKSIFLKKARFYNEVLNQELTQSYFEKRGLPSEESLRYVNALRYHRSVIEQFWNHPLSTTFGDLYLMYANVNLNACYVTNGLSSRIEQYMRRYRLDEAVNEEQEHINYLLWHSIQVYCSLTFGLEQFTRLVGLEARAAQEKLNKKILDYFNDILGD